MIENIQQKALNHIWYPCSQMKDYEQLPPIHVEKAKGSYLYLKDNSKVIDAISSWWCKSLGHQHPKIKQAIKEQLDCYEHIIGTNTISPPLIKLSETLCQLTPTLNKVFYAGDGSCAIEVAMKMSLHSRKILKQHKRTKFISLSNGYHGETLATLSVSDVGIYKNAYRELCFPCIHITDLPYVNSTDDPLWHDASSHWPKIEKQLLTLKETATAIIFEPILQGAGGMRIYSADLLKRIAEFANRHNIHLIADEIMTGFGRTGKTLACEHAQITPDFICLSKGLTAGTLPLSAILTSDDIYTLFYDDYETGKSFLHSNTFGGNALAAAAANAAIEVYQQDNISNKAQLIGQQMRNAMGQVKIQTGSLTNIRQIGAMVAADLNLLIPRAGFKLFNEAIKLGAFLRPLGNTIYWLPPLNTEQHTIDELSEITIKAIHNLSR